MSLRWIVIVLAAVFAILPSSAFAAEPAPAPPVQDIGWPRQLTRDGNVLVYYQPEVDEWKNYKELTCRVAFSLTPKGGKQLLGVASLKADTLVDKESRTVFLRDITVTSVRVPSADAGTAARIQQAFTSMMPAGGEPISVDRILAMVERGKMAARAAPVKHDPPPIFYSERAAVLLVVDGEPAHAPVEGTELEFVVNANWDLFRDKATKEYFLLTEKGWLAAKALGGPWTATRTLPKDMAKLPADKSFDAVKKKVPAPPAPNPPPEVIFSKVPAELVLLKGPAVYTKIPGTRLLYATNTDNDVFVDDATKQIYLLLSGRWFRSAALNGPWTFASANLPPDFAKIPPASPKRHVLASVPGTDEAADAVMLAQIPTTAVIDKAAAAAGVVVVYDGPPQFKPIPPTTVQYAVNTDQTVLKVGNAYYVCFQGVWFTSTAPTGPW
ncbi:MAG TPA: hypothetical protein VFZ53_24055, partial [Polyangiaceae bacterium]